MRIDDDPTEHYACAMPRYYAIPVILLNKRLAYFEAQCAPDGTPFPLGDGSPGLNLRERKEYTYLWRLRCRFLQAVFDMNHERQLDEAWQCDTIHGYVHRTYKRYGHDTYQRHAYWKGELEAGRMPYATPALAEMGMCFLRRRNQSLPYPALPLPAAEYFFPVRLGSLPCRGNDRQHPPQRVPVESRQPGVRSPRSGRPAARELAGVAQGWP